MKNVIQIELFISFPKTIIYSYTNIKGVQEILKNEVIAYRNWKFHPKPYISINKQVIVESEIDTRPTIDDIESFEQIQISQEDDNSRMSSHDVEMAPIMFENERSKVVPTTSRHAEAASGSRPIERQKLGEVISLEAYKFPLYLLQSNEDLFERLRRELSSDLGISIRFSDDNRELVLEKQNLHNRNQAPNMSMDQIKFLLANALRQQFTKFELNYEQFGNNEELWSQVRDDTYKYFNSLVSRPNVCFLVQDTKKRGRFMRIEGEIAPVNEAKHHMMESYKRHCTQLQAH